MKALINFIRLIVGVLFIFSGFVKMVDPLGFSYKLEEYLGPAVFDISFLVPYTLLLAIFLVILELLLGVMLLIGYAMKFTRWALVIIMVFFTFLTFYSAYFDKVTDCGCFGDAIPLNPWQSFIKDVILLILVILLFKKNQYIKPLFDIKPNKWIVFVVFIGCLSLTYQVLTHLPVIDFRPYKIGNSIPEGMIAEGSELPPIHDFFIFQGNEEVTEEVLAKEKLLFVVSYSMEKSEKEGWEKVRDAAKAAKNNGYEIIGVTSSSDKNIDEIKEAYKLDFDFYDMDETTAKTIVRSNPGLLILNKGVILQKVHWNDAEDLKFDKN